MKIKLNRQQFKDKILACWIGKNIGGTMGTPYEGQRQIQDIHGFNSPKGEPLPNDDLDLQLVWLTALEQVGPQALDANILSDYWVSYIPPHWNEYGIGKANLKMGLLPPMSGEYCNEAWKNSNGAWIRSEIWACTAPGFPNIAVKYAMMDSSVDHGISEGTYAEMFTASMESMAFFETDIRTVVEKALEYIPEDCRVARSVKMVLREYDKKTPYHELREMLVKDNEDLGWFQAPGNIAFTVLGLIYGEGDFKNSLIYAINCGDDTDCTGATCGSLLGIMGGMKAIPQDWNEYIGNRIITVAADASYRALPKDCDELTERVLEMIPTVLKAHGVIAEFTDDATEYNKEEALQILQHVSDDFIYRSPYSFEIGSNQPQTAVVEYEKAPVVAPMDCFKIKVTFKNNRPDPHHLDFTVSVPEGWSAEYKRTAYLPQETANSKPKSVWELTVNVGETVAVNNKLSVFVSSASHPLPLMIPIVLLG